MSPYVALLSILLSSGSKDVYDEVFGDLTDIHFPDPELQRVFRECRNQYNNDRPIDITTVNVPINLLDKVMEYSHMSSQVGGFIAEIIDMHNTRELELIGLSIINQAQDKTPVRDIINYINDATDKIVSGKDQTTISLTDLIDKFSSEEAYRAMSESVITTGIIDLDKKLIVRSGDLIIIAGRPSMGKTAFALELSKRVARKGKAAGFISLEMRSDSLLYRLAQSEGRFPGYEGYQDGLSKLAGLPIYFDDHPRQNIPILRQKIKNMVQKYDVGTVFIDYLTLLDPPQAENRNLQIAKLSSALKGLAREYDIPLIVLSQLNRAVEARSDKRPQMSDLRDSGAIEQDADTIMFAYRPFKYGINEVDGVSSENYFELIIDKQRNGSTGAVELFYDPKRQFFGDWGGGRHGF